MTTAQQPIKERRQSTRTMIDNLLAERKEVLILYSRVAGLQPFDEDDDDTNVLRQFIQLLVDYIAAAHFGLYERIVSGQERRKAVLTTAQQIYPSIAATTEVSVAFNDKYEGKSPAEVDDELNRDLSKLGENLASRIELEDRLIATLFEPKPESTTSNSVCSSAGAASAPPGAAIGTAATAAAADTPQSSSSCFTRSATCITVSWLSSVFSSSIDRAILFNLYV